MPSIAQHIALVAAGALASIPGSHACTPGDILNQNFDQYSGGWQPWTKDMAKTDFPKDASGNGGLIFLKDESLQDVGEGMLRARNPQGCVGTAECGATFDVRLPPLDEATLSYRFMHSPGYVYGRGGKLPGMCAFDCPAGCKTVTDSSGFNARIMWRQDNLMSYSYYAGMPEDTHCGENWYWDSTTSSGVWHTIEMYLKINTDGQANGVQRIKYDGREVFARDDIKWTTQYHPIEKLTFRSFHGGGSPDWASAQEQYIFFDDIKVSSSQCGFGDFSAIVPPSADSIPAPGGVPIPIPTVEPPMDVPTETPVEPPVESTPLEPPVVPPVETPVEEAFAKPPAVPPVVPPVRPPVVPPVQPPVVPPVETPVEESPAKPPAVPPVVPPVQPPVVPPVETPVEESPAKPTLPTPTPTPPPPLGGGSGPVRAPRTPFNFHCGKFFTPVCGTEPACEPGLAPRDLGGKPVCLAEGFPPLAEAANPNLFPPPTGPDPGELSSDPSPPAPPTGAANGNDGAPGEDGAVAGDGGDGGSGIGGDFTPEEFHSGGGNGNVALARAGGSVTTFSGSSSPEVQEHHSEPLFVEQKESDDDDGTDALVPLPADDDESDDDEPVSAGSHVSGSGRGRGRGRGGRNTPCTPVPGYYCTASNRLRKVKNRTRRERRQN